MSETGLTHSPSRDRALIPPNETGLTRRGKPLRIRPETCEEWVKVWRAQQQVEKADENDAFKLHLISGIPVKRIRQILHQKYYQQFAASQDKGMVNSYHAEMIRISHSKIVRKVVEDCELVAALALEKQLSHANPQVVFNAATAILDRGGSLERHQNIIVEHRISEDQLERAREIARQLRPKKVEALPPGDVLEGEVVNVEPTRNSG